MGAVLEAVLSQEGLRFPGGRSGSPTRLATATDPLQAFLPQSGERGHRSALFEDPSLWGGAQTGQGCEGGPAQGNFGAWGC